MDDKLPVWDWPDWGIFTGPRLRWVARTRGPYENPGRFRGKKMEPRNYRQTRTAKRKAQKMAHKMQRGW